MKILLGCLACLCLTVIWADTISAQTEEELVSSDEIEKALARPTTRGIERPRTRGIRVTAKVEAKPKAKVDLYIPFEIDSSDLKPEAEKQLMQLEDALQKDELSGSRFEIVGHTDASGSAAYNRKLSEARAAMVKQFLVDRGVDSNRLNIVGRGEDELLYPDQPLHGANRRVEINNLGEQ